MKRRSSWIRHSSKAQQVSEEFEKAYSTYLDSNGMNDFQNGLFGYMLDLYMAGKR